MNRDIYPRIMELVNKNIYRYRTVFIELSFEALASRLNTVEFEIINDIVLILKRFFIEHGCIFQDNSVPDQPANFEILPEFIKNSRVLSIKIFSIHELHNTKSFVIDINHFGQIKKIIIEYPKKIEFSLDFIKSQIEYMVKSAYSALEVSFEENCKFLDYKVFKKLQADLRMQLKVSGKEHLENRYCFNICDNTVGYHCFDQSLMKSITSHFKRMQNDVLSPIELTLWLMREPLPFQQSLTLESFREMSVRERYWETSII